MIYIPITWLKNAENEEKVRKLLETLNTDIDTGNYEKQYEKVLSQLEKLNENIIIEKLNKGEFCLGG